MRSVLRVACCRLTHAQRGTGMKLQVYEEISSAIRAEHSVEWLGKVAARYPKCECS